MNMEVARLASEGSLCHMVVVYDLEADGDGRDAHITHAIRPTVGVFDLLDADMGLKLHRRLVLWHITDEGERRAVAASGPAAGQRRRSTSLVQL